MQTAYAGYNFSRYAVERAPETVTLRTVYEAHIEPNLKSLNTKKAYRAALSCWERAVDSPTIVSITHFTLKAFRDFELERGMSLSYIAKNERHLSVIFRRASKADLHNRAGLGIIDLPPYLEPINVKQEDLRKQKKVLSKEEWSALLTAARKMPVSSEEWERLVLILYITGARTSDLVYMLRNTLTSDCDYPLAKIPDAKWPYGWVSWIPGKTENSSGTKVAIPIPEWAAKKLHSASLNQKALFPTFYRLKIRNFYNWWDFFKLSVSQVLGVEFNAGPQDCRVTCNLHWPLETGPLVLGHTMPGKSATNTNHYYFPALKLIEAVKLLPPIEPAKVQRTLFSQTDFDS